MKTVPISAASIAFMAAGMGAEIASATAGQPAPPDRLSVDKSSPHFDLCYRRLGVLFDGLDRKGDVQEYCVSEGWIIVRRRNAIGQFVLNVAGGYILRKLEGKVEPYWTTQPRAGDTRATPVPTPETDRTQAAEEKRQRKALRNWRNNVKATADNPAEILRDIARETAKELGLAVDEAAFDEASKALDE